MKKTFLIVIIAGILGFLVYWGIQMFEFADGVKKDTRKTQKRIQHSKIQSGDIIFQTSTSNQSKAIQLATNSKYSHMGIIYENDGAYFVYEAVQPVKLTPLQTWIQRGKNGHYVIKRLTTQIRF